MAKKNIETRVNKWFVSDLLVSIAFYVFYAGNKNTGPVDCQNVNWKKNHPQITENGDSAEKC